MSSSITIPAEVLSEILEQTSSSSILPLFELMLVSREWNSLLSTTTSFWRNVKTDPSTRLTPKKLRTLLEKVCSLSRNSVQSVYILQDWRLDRRLGSKGTLFSLLELSRFTLRRIDMHMTISWNLSIFRNFNALERLNLTREELPEVEPSTPGCLALFAAWVEDGIKIEDQDLGWFSHLQALYWKDIDTLECLPEEMLRIIEKCKDSLILLDFDTSANPPSTTTIYELPKLETIWIEYRETEAGSFNILKVPKAKEVYCSPDHQFEKCKEIETLRLQVWCWIEEFEADMKNPEGTEFIKMKQIRLCSCIDLASLRTLQLNANPDDQNLTTYSIDVLLQYLRAKKGLPTVCPNLSKVMLSYRQKYDPELLVELLLSHQVFSHSRNRDPALCSEITLYLSGSKIAAYREAEEKVLGRMSEEEKNNFRIADVCEGKEEWFKC